MNIRGATSVVLTCICHVGCSHAFAVQMQSEPHLENAGQVFDCGTLALYNLLRFEGRSADLATISSHLPAMPAAGYSMKDLRDAAGACGTRLVGIRLKGSARELDRPMIAFLAQGHFVVIRPVGHTGKLVQILDGVDGSEITGKKVVLSSPGWTGLVLVRDRPSHLTWFFIPVACCGGFGLLLLFRPRLRIKRRAAEADLTDKRRIRD
jgi:Peptidase C39 family